MIPKKDTNIPNEKEIEQAKELEGIIDEAIIKDGAQLMTSYKQLTIMLPYHPNKRVGSKIS